MTDSGNPDVEATSKLETRATKASLLLRIRDSGDCQSWNEFTEIYDPVIRSYCRRRGLQPNDADDVVQEILSQVARSIGTFAYEPQRGRFRDWLGTVTRNKIHRFFETKGREGLKISNDESLEFGTCSEDSEWSTHMHERILEVALIRVRGDFEPTTWDAFERIWCLGRPAPEVARSLGMTIDAVYAAKSRILKRLREEVLLLADDLPMALSPR